MKTKSVRETQTSIGFGRLQVERPAKFVLGVASATDREAIYRARYEVYTPELGQHAANGGCQLSDSLDAQNVYIVAHLNGALAGFVSITPPSAKAYSVD